jgi:hypothetical protein
VPSTVHFEDSEQQYTVKSKELLLSDVVQVHRIEAVANAARVGLVQTCGGVSDVDDVSYRNKLYVLVTA